MTDIERIEVEAKQNTLNGALIRKTTNDTEYNQGQYDFVNDYYTEAREYFLMCNGF